MLGIDIFGALETDASFLLFFPSQYQADNARIALPAFCHMVAPEVEFEDEILGGIQCLASLAEPVAAVALCQLDNLGTDMFQESFSLLFAENIEYIVQYMEEDVVIAAESHLLICRCRAHDVTVEIRLTLVGYTQKVSKLVGIGGRIIVGENISIKREFTEERPHASGNARHRTEGCEYHRLGMRMLVERCIDTLLITYFIIFLQNCIPHPIFKPSSTMLSEKMLLPAISEEMLKALRLSAY